MNPFENVEFVKQQPRKKWYLHQLQKLDADYGLSIVREIEMTVESAISERGYIIQFFTDARLYGMDEAILYVRNGKYGDAESIQTKWDEIRGKIQ